MLFGLYESMVIFDHVNKTINVLSNAHIKQTRTAKGMASTPEDVEGAYNAACRTIDKLVERLTKPMDLGVGEIPEPGDKLPEFVSNFERPAYEAAVEECKEYIRAGDIFQVVPSQRLTVQTKADSFSIYRALRMVNPSPFMFLLKSPQVVLVGASPEIMCRVEDGVVTNRPAGRHPPPRARPKRKTRPWRPSCWPTQRNGPSTSCWWTWAATTWARSAAPARSNWAT